MFDLMKIKGFKPFLCIALCNVFILFFHMTMLQEVIYNTSIGRHDLSLLIGLMVLMILPYIVFFSYSGYITDRWGETKVMKCLARSMLPLCVILVVFYGLGWFWVCYGFTFLLSVQRALCSPARLGYIRVAYGKSNICQGIAWLYIVSATAMFLGVFVGVYCFKWVVESSLMIADASSVALSDAMSAITPIAVMMIVVSGLMFLSTYWMVAAKEQSVSLQYTAKDILSVQYLKSFFSLTKKNKVAMMSVCGLASFWLTSQVLLICYPGYISQYLANEGLAFSRNLLGYGLIGVVAGAWYAGKTSAHFIEVGYVPVAALVLTLCLFFFPTLQSHVVIMLTSIAYSFFGGLLVVPMNALIQFSAEDETLGRVIASSNFLQNSALIVGLLLAVGLLAMGVDGYYLMRIICLIALVVTILALAVVPQGLSRYIVYFIVSKFYRMNVTGLENVPSSGGALLLGNHTSYLDWAIIQMACPRNIRFVMERSIYEKWYIKVILKAYKVIPVSKGGARRSLLAIEEALNDGSLVVIFPEGYISRNGQMGSFHTGFENVMKNCDVPIIPFYLQGLWGSSTSYASKQYKNASKINTRSVSVAFGAPLSPNSTAVDVKRKVFELSITSWRDFISSLGTLPQLWIRSAKKMANELCVADSTGVSLSYHQFMVGVLATAKQLKPMVKHQQNVGILLPTSAAGAIVNMALFVLGKTVVNLNYTSGFKSMQHAIALSEIQTIVSSKMFCEKLKDRGIELEGLLEASRWCYMEDVKSNNKKSTLLRLLFAVKCLPAWALQCFYVKSVSNDSTAAIMFSSGSEGTPKGVELTHYNIIANIKQVASICNIEDSDTFMSMLPLFHCFGLTVTTLLPLLEGATFVCHPDPTDGRAIGRLVFRYQCTFLCGSSTFLGLYARSKKLHPLMFESLRFVIAGAEKLSPQVQQIFKEKFNIDILEGYGTTEVAPVASCNLPDILNPDDMHLHVSNKTGSVGLPLPGSAFRIIDPVSCEELPQGESGMIAIGGPQVMKGYLKNPEKTQQVLLNDDGMKWYITGDKGYLDEDGYLFIVDRYSRFAKMGGEMVSLTVVEHEIHQLLNEPDSELIAVAVSDDKKGERIAVLFRAELSEDELKQRVTQSSLERLMMPSFYLKQDELPKMGSGKVDYVTAKNIAKSIFEK